MVEPANVGLAQKGERLASDPPLRPGCLCSALLSGHEVCVFSITCGRYQVALVDVMFPKMEEGFAILWESGLATPGGLIGKVFDLNGRREVGECILSRQDEGRKAVIDRDPIGDERTGAMVALNIELGIAEHTHVNLCGKPEGMLPPCAVLLIPLVDRSDVPIEFFRRRLTCSGIFGEQLSIGPIVHTLIQQQHGLDAC
jgi:hypothetical protein